MAAEDFTNKAGEQVDRVAVAGPTWKPEPSPFADDATPLMVLLKADSSMRQPDPAP
jgi:Ca-activated chloride channel family protein